MDDTHGSPSNRPTSDGDRIELTEPEHPDAEEAAEATARLLLSLRECRVERDDEPIRRAA